jgi:galactarate dehydratase
MDFDAGRIISGAATMQEMGWELFRTILEVASGRRRTWTEKWQLYNSLALFNPAPVT